LNKADGNLVYLFYIILIFLSLSLDETITDPQDITVLEQRKQELEEVNNMLRTRLDILLTMLAEVNAEEQFKGKVDI
jgi:hypothetical protein